MKISYNENIKQLVLDGEGDIIIPGNRHCISVNSEDLNMLNKNHGVTLGVRNFWYQGKLTLGWKIKLIWQIIRL